MDDKFKRSILSQLRTLNLALWIIACSLLVILFILATQLNAGI